MQKFWTALKQNFWPISALIFCPCHLPLSMAAIASLTAGTVVGGFISTHYSSIETVLAVAFSFYFVLAFMIWVVRGPQPVKALPVSSARAASSVPPVSRPSKLLCGALSACLPCRRSLPSAFLPSKILPMAC